MRPPEAAGPPPEAEQLDESAARLGGGTARLPFGGPGKRTVRPRHTRQSRGAGASQGAAPRRPPDPQLPPDVYIRHPSHGDVVTSRRLNRGKPSRPVTRTCDRAGVPARSNQGRHEGSEKSKILMRKP